MSSGLKEKSIVVDPYDLLRRPYRHFGQGIQWIRDALQLTQDEFGALLEGFSQANIARYESGNVDPPLDFWRKFARAFSVNLTWVITGEGGPYDGIVSQSAERARLQKLLRDYYASGYERGNFNPLRFPGLAEHLGLLDFYNDFVFRMNQERKEQADVWRRMAGGPPGEEPPAVKEVRDAASQKKPKNQRRRKAT
jgi:transcriptional regulator with XRE-family HTH domain